MGLEEPPHCPFDVIEACRTGVRRDSYQSGWRSSRPTVREEATRWLMTHRGLQQRAKGGSQALPAVGRGDGGGAVAAALGRPI